MWNEKELMDEIESYFANVTPEQFMLDLEESGSLEFVQDVFPQDFNSCRQLQYQNAVVSEFTMSNEIPYGVELFRNREARNNFLSLKTEGKPYETALCKGSIRKEDYQTIKSLPLGA